MSIRMISAAVGLVALASIPMIADAGPQATGGTPRGYVIDFSASWCGPCQQMAPLVERLGREGYAIKSVDIDQRPELKAKYNITSLPTFVLFIDGKERSRRVGAMSESDLRRMVQAIPVEQPRASMAADERTPANRSRARANAPDSVASRTKSALLDLLPGRKRQPDAASLDGAVVRANADDRIPEMPIASGPMASSVRIRVRVDGQMNFGSGTIIDSSPGRATVATCWHIFRGATRETKIEVDAFFTGQTETYVAKLVGADEKADVGVIEVSTDSKWPTVRVAPTSRLPEVDDQVVSIGCGGGQDPTRQSIRVTAIDKYLGPNNIECSGLPVRGRSGGGLFNTRGELVGVCSAADKEDKRGFYAGLFAVHDLLDRAQLAHLYQDPSRALASADDTTGRSMPPARLEATAEEFAFADNRGGFGDAGSRVEDGPSADEFLNNAPSARNQPAAPASNDWAAGAFDDFTKAVPATRPATTAAVPTASSNAGVGGADDVEIVCVIRSKSNPKLGSRVIVIDQSDPKLVELLRQYEQQSRR